MTRLLAAWLAFALISSCREALAAPADGKIVPREALVLDTGGGRGGRSAVHTDPIEAVIVSGRWTPPKARDVVTLPGGREGRWQPARADEKGAFDAKARGYVQVSVPRDEPAVMILRAAGHDLVYVNGEPRMGDPYGHGFVQLPVALKAGANDLLFRVARGPLRVTLTRPRAAGQINTADATLPDLLVGQETGSWAGVVVLNTATTPARGLVLRAGVAGASPTMNVLPEIPPLGVRKAAVRLVAPAFDAPGDKTLSLALLGPDDAILDEATLNLAVVRPEQAHRRTFLSEIDGSVQYYGLVPAAGGDPARRAGLILALHGAAVEGIGQARVYKPRPWAHVVAPTNRRPFGFDWEDWGRLDAIEVLDLTARELDVDPRRIYLTGHSMGGHGTWHVGLTFPDRFAAIAPSAGWVSMASYAGMRRPEGSSGIADLLARASSSSDTLALVRNAAGQGVYVLHGDVDDNVPVDQARTMRRELAAFHPDFTYYERPGAGHWWGDECCDWPPLMEFLGRHERPRREDVTRIDFRTASPGVSAWCHWAGVLDQVERLRPSGVKLTLDPKRRRVAGTTENVSRLALDLAPFQGLGKLEVELDGQVVASEVEGKPNWFFHEEKTWKVEPSAPPPARKGPHRYGPFKEAFRHRVRFIYGTRGNAEENAWALAKARYDAETFWYRGNGSIDVLADTDVDPAAASDRSVVLYGNADTNAAWAALLGDGPVQVKRGHARIGERELRGQDLACLFLRPRPGSDVATVGVVAGSGLEGSRLSDRVPYFVSGVGLPDLLVLGSDALGRGIEGIRAAGYFGADWGVGSGEFAWRD